MHIRVLGAVLALCVLMGDRAFAQPTGDDAKLTQKHRAEAQRQMGQLISTAQFQDEVPFGKFLESLSKHLASEGKLTVRLDRAAFGKDADKLLNEKVMLPPVPARMRADTALRLAISRAFGNDLEIEFIAGPNEYLITTRDRSLMTESYDVRDLLPLVPRLHEDFKRIEDRTPKDGGLGIDGFASWFDLKADPGKPAQWLVHQIVTSTQGKRAGWSRRTPASTIRIQNGTKLIVHTVPSIHAEIEQLLMSLRRLADVAVVMNARVYALDRAEYEKQFASSFVDPKDKSPRLATTVTKTQWALLEKRTPIMASDADKLVPFVRVDFLTRQSAYQFQAQPGDAQATTAFEGFIYAVRPDVSPDRRCIRLEVFHGVEQLVKLTKGTMLDLKTNKEMPIELPNLRKSQASGAIEIHDGQPILLRMDYRVQDKVWLVLAEPRIYMEEEEEHMRKSAIKPMPLADEKPAPPEPAEAEEVLVQLPAVEVPHTEASNELLQAVLLKVMTDPDLKAPREHYGTPGDGKFVLTNSDTLAWPRKFQPKVPGYQAIKVDLDECRSFKPRLLGIELRSYRRAEVKPGDWRAHVEVVLFNVGGTANGSAIRSCRVLCQAQRVNGQWVVQCFAGGSWEVVEP